MSNIITIQNNYFLYEYILKYNLFWCNAEMQCSNQTPVYRVKHDVFQISLMKRKFERTIYILDKIVL